MYTFIAILGIILSIFIIAYPKKILKFSLYGYVKKDKIVDSEIEFTEFVILRTRLFGILALIGFIFLLSLSQ